MIEPSESNPFARATGARLVRAGRLRRSARLALGLTLTLVLAACFTLALLLLGALVVRGARRDDWVALAAALAVVALTVIMARGLGR